MPSRALSFIAACVLTSACNEQKPPAEQEVRPQSVGQVSPPPAAHPSPNAELPAGHPPIPAQQRVSGPPRNITPSGNLRQHHLADLDVKVPEEWETRPPSSGMRLAEFVVPGPGGDAELAVFRFPGGAGGVEANIERWKSQFQAEGGGVPPAKVDVVQETPVKITVVDVAGRYVAPARPGGSERQDVPEQRMLAAIVEGSGDPFFFKLVGPAATVKPWQDAWHAMAKSMSVTSKTANGVNETESPNEANAPNGPKGANKPQQG